MINFCFTLVTPVRMKQKKNYQMVYGKMFSIKTLFVGFLRVLLLNANKAGLFEDFFLAGFSHLHISRKTDLISV